MPAIPKHRKKLLAPLVLILTATQVSASPRPLPEVIESVSPSYPPGAEDAGHWGTVRVALAISKEGLVTNCAVTASSRSDELDQAALLAARQWRFKPVTDDSGSPVEARVIIPFVFKRPDRFLHQDKSCQALVVEMDWLKTAYPKIGLNNRYILKSEFRGLIKTYLDSEEEEKIYPKLLEKLDQGVELCRKTPEAKARDILTGLVKDEEYYQRPLTEEERRDEIRKVLSTIQKITSPQDHR